MWGRNLASATYQDIYYFSLLLCAFKKNNSLPSVSYQQVQWILWCWWRSARGWLLHSVSIIPSLKPTCAPSLASPPFFCSFGYVLSSPMLKQAVCTTGSAFGREVFGKFSLHTSGHWQRMAIWCLEFRCLLAWYGCSPCAGRMCWKCLCLVVSVKSDIVFSVIYFMYFPFQIISWQCVAVTKGHVRVV